MKRCFLIFTLLILSRSIFSQEKSSFEIYSGPSKAFLPFKVYPANYNISSSSPLSWHVGIGYVTEFSQSWQLTAQLEFVKRELGTYAFSTQADSIRITGYSTDLLPLIALGVRKNWIGFSRSFFLQPSFSIMKSPAFLDTYEPAQGDSFMGFPLGLESVSDLGLGLRLEGGVKKHLKDGNYFSIGVRYQQGLVLMDQMNAPVFYSDRLEHVLVAKSKGSYAGIYLGFGLISQKLKKSPSKSLKKVLDEEKLEKAKLASQRGIYAYLSGGMRIRENVLHNPYTYSNLSGQYQIGMGYYLNGFSLEAGFGNFSYNNNYQFDYDGHEAVFMNFEHFTASGIPLTLKYHLSLDSRNSWKVGPSFSGFMILANSGANIYSKGNGYSKTIIGDKAYEAIRSFRTLPSTQKGKWLFNTGLFVERRIFNSSFMSMKLSRNFGSPVLSRIESLYQIDDLEIIQLNEGGLNGYLVDVGFRLPMKLLAYNKRDDF